MNKLRGSPVKSAVVLLIVASVTPVLHGAPTNSDSGVGASATTLQEASGLAPPTGADGVDSQVAPAPAGAQTLLGLKFNDCKLTCDMCEEFEMSRDRCWCVPSTGEDPPSYTAYVSDNGGPTMRIMIEEVGNETTAQTTDDGHVYNDANVTVEDMGQTVWQEYKGDDRQKTACPGVPTAKMVRNNWKGNHSIELLTQQSNEDKKELHDASLASDDGVTVIIMSYNRPESLLKDVLPSLSAMDVVKQVIVSHGRADTFFETPDLPKVLNVRDFVRSDRVGLMRRFELASRVEKTRCVLWMDDDQHPTESAVVGLYEQWRKAPMVLHGHRARQFTIDPDTHSLGYWPRNVFPYAKQNDVLPDESPVTMVLTQFVMGDRDLGYYAFLLGQDAGVQRWALEHSKPLWNGEDIFFNMASVYYNAMKGRTTAEDVLPRVHRDLTDSVHQGEQDERSIWLIDDFDHYSYRSEAVSRFATYFAGLAKEEGVTLDFSKFAVEVPASDMPSQKSEQLGSDVDSHVDSTPEEQSKNTLSSSLTGDGSSVPTQEAA